MVSLWVGWAWGPGCLSGILRHPQHSPEAHCPTDPHVSQVHPPGLAFVPSTGLLGRKPKPEPGTSPEPCSRVLPGSWEEPADEEEFGRTPDPGLEDPRNGEENLTGPTAPHQSLAQGPWP